MIKQALVLGGDGMLGHKVFQVFNRKFDTHASFLSHAEYVSAFPVYREVPASRIHLGVNVLNETALEELFSSVQPDVVLNCIGLIKQLEEASNSILAIRMNSLLPHRLAELCNKYGSKLVHISTDCVFSGRKGSYTESDPPDALDLYGKSKALGEVDYSPHLTVRTSIIGREWVRSTALLEWFLSQKGKSVRGYKNAVYTGLTTEAFANVVLKTVTERPDLTGLWQVSSDVITKYDLLKQICDAWNLDVSIEPYDDPPCDRSLDSTRFFTETGFERPSWESMINGLVKDDLPYEEWRERNSKLIEK